jgi:hypothetical protein
MKRQVLELSSTTREEIARLPNDDAFDLDGEHVVGILGRHQLARQCLCRILARETSDDPQDALLLDSLRLLIELDVPVMLRAIAKDQGS